jgi:FtsP/CotA-like multicopper oxidase with cupredoxin domain
LRLIPASLFALLALVALAAAFLTGVNLASVSAQTEVRRYTLYVREGWLTMPDGASVYVWGFTDDPKGPPQVPGPAIIANEGDSVEVTLVNDVDPTANALLVHGEGHTIHLHGLDTPTEHDGVPETHAPGLVRQGGSYTYRFVAKHAGTYFYHCHQNNVEHQQMGMFGPIVIKAANGAKTAYTGGPAYDREHTLVLAEMDRVGHDAARRAFKEDGQPYNWLRYAPNDYFVNDRAFSDPSAVLQSLTANPGERVLVRVINAGYVAQSFHSHDRPFQIVASDGRPWRDGPTTDMVWLGPGEKYDLLFLPAEGSAIAAHLHVDQPYQGPMVGVENLTTATAAQPTGATRAVTLYVRDGWQTMPDGARIFVRGFSDSPESAAMAPGPKIVATEGDTVEITLVNDGESPDGAHALGLRGLPAPPDWFDATPPGESRTYSFMASRAGSYFYVGDPTGVESQQMGMYGAIVVKPAADPRTAYRDGPTFDAEYTMVLSEMDAEGHEQTRLATLGQAAPYDWTRLMANYFLINGLAYPDTMESPSTMMRAAPGARVLIRAINAGHLAHAMHLHGYHFQIVGANGRPWTQGPLKETILIAPGESYELLFVADQDGLFPFHDHFETANTNNGVWLGGMHTMVATGPVHHASPATAAPAAAADGATVYVRDNYYAPNIITVPLGTAVTWAHQGQVEHTVSSLRGLFDSGTLLGGQSFTFTPPEPGRYDYFCRFHITNRGSVIVE